MMHLLGRDDWSEIVAEGTTTLWDEQNRARLSQGFCKVVREGLKPKTYNLWPMNFSFGGSIK